MAKTPEDEVGVNMEAIGTYRSAFKHMVGTTIGAVKFRLELSSETKKDLILHLRRQVDIFLGLEESELRNIPNSKYFIDADAVQALCQRILDEDMTNVETARSVVAEYLRIIK